ncbi:hypothetical protein PORY_001992 [Pneumocystis oryctolagi]|uniref:Uncharacterized protein n=1 Tax=Pneumocystis oryctolagi TaxID=42067 RepID=A0ACB7CA46_9ASCO|nr:hypothetical protein PORY_001992 [Pneumocystis oryctolagi]
MAKSITKKENTCNEKKGIKKVLSKKGKVSKLNTEKEQVKSIAKTIEKKIKKKEKNDLPVKKEFLNNFSSSDNSKETSKISSKISSKSLPKNLDFKKEKKEDKLSENNTSSSGSSSSEDSSSDSNSKDLLKAKKLAKKIPEKPSISNVSNSCDDSSSSSSDSDNSSSCSSDSTESSVSGSKTSDSSSILDNSETSGGSYTSGDSNYSNSYSFNKSCLENFQKSFISKNPDVNSSRKAKQKVDSKLISEIKKKESKTKDFTAEKVTGNFTKNENHGKLDDNENSNNSEKLDNEKLAVSEKLNDNKKTYSNKKTINEKKKNNMNSSDKTHLGTSSLDSNKNLSNTQTSSNTADSHTVSGSSSDSVSNNSSNSSDSDSDSTSDSTPVETDKKDIKKNKTNTGENAEGSTVVFVGGLSWNIDDNQLAKEFENVGTVIASRVISNKNSGKSKGCKSRFGYVEFSKPEEAQAALAYSGKEIDGRVINVDISTKRSTIFKDNISQRANKYGDVQSPKSDTLFIGNLSFKANEESIRAVFSKIGKIVDIRLPVNRETGRSKGFGYIQFSTVKEAEKAIEMNGHFICGRPIRLDFSTSKDNNVAHKTFDNSSGAYERKNKTFQKFSNSKGKVSSTNRSGFNEFSGKKTKF